MSEKIEHCVIIGGSSGIGLATARKLVGPGMKVTITGRNEDKLKNAWKTLGGTVGKASFDATRPGDVRHFFDSLGPFDHLVLAASGGKGLGPFATLDLADIGSGVDEKIRPQLSCLQAALPTLSKAGSVTFISAVSAQLAAPGIAGIGAINGMLLTVAPILAVELKPLRVNVVAPGVIDTPWWDFLPGEQRQAVFAEYAGKTPVGRIGRAEDVADAIAFLVCNGFMTGQVLTCDGGLRYAA
ncbi:SDR family oxidoreductase [Mesorhizobium sp. M4A.F.Ca.ET.020.02.1.1]|uniref:SDR family oxidoreductase n=1 Tax=unclassified Mesorhizobium TaxID=325217 RepID=UPI000FCA988D|nr:MULTISPECIES: SDR family oxidoreductase [unclassified Mesorhizobium]RVD73812.1 SDR family oxidoreductase [Mesorhizobium sp. M4A.F.Ca.ET.029.04.2.1]RUX45721.1 SDR family oxidoreductase [Mesorhizobium sp. M4A.F.Ca.ET.050.02.1.1]RVD41308.1 SDR family oxidoreductase [Mesorhizobium sp. M4A.F.Ca.ET.020.02.1.1]RWC18746.1 MAG: SDR family oxidoreductase [Mesorhizobium sp.]RWD33794.1 MAG: SDR family oxidoreductase [Mesorhizobium sp.]